MQAQYLYFPVFLLLFRHHRYSMESTKVKILAMDDVSPDVMAQQGVWHDLSGESVQSLSPLYDVEMNIHAWICVTDDTNVLFKILNV